VAARRAGRARALLVVLVALACSPRASRGARRRRRAVAFNLRHGEALTRIARPPAASACASSSAATATSSRRSPCARCACRPTAARSPAPTRLRRAVIADLRGRFADFELADEGRVRINEAPGYAIGFRARRDGRACGGARSCSSP
jgi:hypothetical protein